MTWNTDDVPVYRAVVETGGITAAANLLHKPKSTVSTIITRLEHDLGVRLLDRNSRKVRMTSEGETFYRQCLLIMEQVAETDALMAGLSAVPAGRLNVALPSAFCQEILAPRLSEFRALYPSVDLSLVVTSQPVDVLGEQFDIAIVVGAQTDSELAQKTLLTGRLIWIASPDYLARNTIGPAVEDVRAHVQICETRYASQRFPLRANGQLVTTDLAHNIVQVNDPVSVREAVAGGAGISFIPERYCGKYLQSGDLVEVCEHIRFDMTAAVLSAVFPTRRLMSTRVRAFLDFLEVVCRETVRGCKARQANDRKGEDQKRDGSD